jgi:hypothetical protein
MIPTLLEIPSKEKVAGPLPLFSFFVFGGARRVKLSVARQCASFQLLFLVYLTAVTTASCILFSLLRRHTTPSRTTSCSA